MRLLLDTSALIWFLDDDQALSHKAKAAIEDPAAVVYVSAVSAYEIELKRTFGRAMPALPADLGAALVASGFVFLPITFAHAAAAGRLSMTHKDPWDRLLIAQTQTENMPIVTPDPAFAAFGCRVLW